MNITETTAASNEESSGSSPSPATITGTIMVCEDEEAVRVLVVKQLQRSGYKVVSACDGPDALRVAADPDLDLVMLITDVIMPQMNGLELSQALTEKIPGLKTLFLSGYSGKMLAEKGIQTNKANFLAKPYRKEDLFDQIQKLWLA